MARIENWGSFIFLASMVLLSSCVSKTQKKLRTENPVYLFGYFTDNGEDGLHLAYSEDGLQWKVLKDGQSFLHPTAGHDKLMRDPCIIHGPDGLFHMVWTVSWKERGIGIASSPDLIHWSEQHYLPVMESEPDAQNCWAPEIFYDPNTQQYLLFWATTIPGKDPTTDRQIRPGSTGKNNRIYYTISKDLKEFSPAKLFYDHGFNVIDATLVLDHSQYRLFLKDETDAPFTPEKNIRIATSNRAVGPYTTPSPPITGPYWAEGPTAIQIKGTWFVYFDRYREHRYGAVMSTDIKHWIDITDQLHFPANARHGTVLPISPATLESLINLKEPLPDPR